MNVTNTNVTRNTIDQSIFYQAPFHVYSNTLRMFDSNNNNFIIFTRYNYNILNVFLSHLNTGYTCVIYYNTVGKVSHYTDFVKNLKINKYYCEELTFRTVVF